jgi:hypothetical protein
MLRMCPHPVGRGAALTHVGGTRKPLKIDELSADDTSQRVSGGWPRTTSLPWGVVVSDRSKVEAVASGKPYTVTLVNDHAPERLDDFVDRAVVAFTVATNDQTVEVCGCAHLADDSVLVHEKDDSGIGKDVRTWRVRHQDGGFIAVERSTY